MIVGLMSGTSLDGVDAAAIETDGERVLGFGPAVTLPYDDALRARLRALIAAPREDPDTVRLLTERHVDAVRALGVRPTLIGFHGQTILHDPASRRTWQIGDAASLARALDAPVVHDFRSNDVASGGQGAPLVPVFHAALLPRDVPRPAVVLNIGGVANLTFVPGFGTDGLVACDTGPGNALLDDWALRHTGVPCDRDGALSRAGIPDHVRLATLLADPFFRRAAPKSLDRQSFARALDLVAPLSPADGAATLAAFTVGAVARTPLPAAPRAWFVCGGGRHNPALMNGLRATLSAPVAPVEAIGWNGDAVEAQCFAFLAARSVLGLPLSYPGTTGVEAPCTGGRLFGALPRAPGGACGPSTRIG